MKKLAVLISGGGTNLQAIIDAIETGTLQATIAIVAADREDVKGLNRAKKHSLPVVVVKTKRDLLPLLKKYNPDYICLAGFKQIVDDDVLQAYKNKILNMHPGLIPDTLNGAVENPDGTKGLWNRGKFTDTAVADFLNHKVTYAGATLHFLSDDFDFGPVLGRTFEKVQRNDTVDSLYERLKKKEHGLYVDVLKKLCNV